MQEKYPIDDQRSENTKMSHPELLRLKGFGTSLGIIECQAERQLQS
jgi:hypothetical protein